jgi:hypothetical protein
MKPQVYRFSARDRIRIVRAKMNTRTAHIVRFSCILKAGDRADQRMTELNELIESDKPTAAATRSLAISRKRDHESANPPKGRAASLTQLRIPNRDAR